MKTYYCTLGTYKQDGSRFPRHVTTVVVRNAVEARYAALAEFNRVTNAKRLRARRIRVELVDNGA